MPKYDHDNWGDIADHIFAKGVITAVDSENDTADVTVEGYQNGADIPIYYHCDPESEEQANGSIKGGAAAFGVDDEVIVMCTTDGHPVRIIGFVDGIKECGGAYLVISTVYYKENDPDAFSSFYVIWDVAKEKLVDSITFEGETISFPYKAAFSFYDMPTGEVASWYDYYNQTPDEYGKFPHQYDPFYRWLRSRPWPPDDESLVMNPDPDHIGFPVWPVMDAVLFSEVGYAGAYYNVEYPDAGAGCAPGCIWLSKLSGECSDDTVDEVLARGKLGDELEMVNKGTGSYTATCAIGFGGDFPGYTASGADEYYSSTTYELASVPQSSNFFQHRNLVNNTGPFVTATIARLSNPSEIVSGLYQPELTTRVVSEEQSWEVSGVWEMGAGYSPGTATGWGGSASGYTTEIFEFTFETPLGKLDPIKVGGSGMTTYGGNVNTGGFSAELIGVVFTDKLVVTSFVEPQWIGDLFRCINKRNKYFCKVARHGDVMYQIYYYSAYIQSYNQTMVDGLITEKTAVETDAMTSHLEAVKYYPQRDAISLNPFTLKDDPLEMTPGSLSAAINALVSVAEQNNAHGVLWNLDVRLFH